MFNRCVVAMIVGVFGFGFGPCVYAVPKVQNKDAASVQEIHGNFNINTATLKQWQAIKGIGKKRAQAIISYREQHGAFSSASALQHVRGISKASFDRLQNKNAIKFVVDKHLAADVVKKNK